MKLAIMQPYFFPYLGYFHLVNAVDKFVFYDDVNYIKNGWINRNRLLFSDNPKYFTIPLAGASPFLKIDQICVQQNGIWQKKLSELMRYSYLKAPNFKVVHQLFSDVLFVDDIRISELAKLSVKAVSEYLGLATQFIESSSVYKNVQLKGAERVLDICIREKASEYYNLPGGRLLYDEELFNLNGVELHFILPKLVPYKQFLNTFQPCLSIIDVLMFNDKDAIREMLNVGERL
jgi:hypothetical protein